MIDSGSIRWGVAMSCRRSPAAYPSRRAFSRLLGPIIPGFVNKFVQDRLELGPHASREGLVIAQSLEVLLSQLPGVAGKSLDHRA